MCDQAIDKILEIHRLCCEVDALVPTVGMGEGYKVEWHIHGYDNFRKVADELNDGKYKVSDTGWGPYRYRYEFDYRGVNVFCLVDDCEVTTDAK